MNNGSPKELWDATKELSGSYTRARVIYEKVELQKTRKGGMKMDQYLTTMKSIVDNLPEAGNPIYHSELTVQILSEFDT